jgi:hypothetical protein
VQGALCYLRFPSSDNLSCVLPTLKEAPGHCTRSLFPTELIHALVRTRKPEWVYADRGFESLPLRSFHQKLTGKYAQDICPFFVPAGARDAIRARLLADHHYVELRVI